jgi:hypothetical protein
MFHVFLVSLTVASIFVNKSLISVAVALLYVCIWNHAGDIENAIKRISG